MSVPIHCSYDELVPIKDLKPHPKNRNKHPSEQIDRLAKIITYQGIRSPIKVSKRSGYITAGHGRLEAFRKLKIKKAPVNFQDYETDEQEYADIQSDNAVALWAELDLSGINTDIADLGPDFDLDLLGIKDFVLEPADKLAPGCDEDEVPEVKDTRAKLGDRWTLGNHVLVCGDSTDVCAVDALMAGEKPELIFSDPPYGIDYQDVKKNHKKIDNDSDLDAIEGLLTLTLSFDCPTFLCCNWKCYSTFEKAMSAAGKNPKACIVWDKGSRVQNLDKFGKQHEFVLYYGPFGGEQTVDVDVWQCKRQVLKEHPTSKPIELIERALNHFTAKSVLDLFGGSGSTLIACEKTNRKCFMMEIDPHYCDVILARWEKYTGKVAELQTGGPDGKES